jgi:hypothetical protein
MGSYPALTALGLDREQLVALARQGNLHAERSGAGRCYWKLRFRVAGRQCVRYIGNHPGFVDQVRGELMRLQAPAKSRHHLRRLVRTANECLRKTQEQLKPFLPLAGRCFHGREIRRQTEDGDARDVGKELFFKNPS